MVEEGLNHWMAVKEQSVEGHLAAAAATAAVSFVPRKAKSHMFKFLFMINITKCI